MDSHHLDTNGAKESDNLSATGLEDPRLLDIFPAPFSQPQYFLGGCGGVTDMGLEKQGFG